MVLYFRITVFSLIYEIFFDLHQMKVGAPSD